ncbi:MAG: hypothetical protein RLZZ528_1518 [Pseudomonadota bacterium]
MFRLPLTDPDRDYAPIADFAEPARARAELWRLAAGAVLAVAVYLGTVSMVVGLVLGGLDPISAGVVLENFASGRTEAGMTALLLSFLPMALGIFAAARLLHGRGPWSLFGPKARVQRDFLRVALPLVALGVVLLPLSAASGDVGRHMGFLDQVIWYPLALPALLIQTGAEEVAFRGYLMQQLAARFRARVVWMVLPALVFGWLHLDAGTFGPNALAVALWALVFGLLAADLTARTGSLGAAIGFHFGTNFSALFLTGLYGNLDGLALFNLVVDPSDTGALLPYLAADLVFILVAWLLARVMLRV